MQARALRLELEDLYGQKVKNFQFGKLTNPKTEKNQKNAWDKNASRSKNPPRWKDMIWWGLVENLEYQKGQLKQKSKKDDEPMDKQKPKATQVMVVGLKHRVSFTFGAVPSFWEKITISFSSMF